MRTALRKMGNSTGMIVPAALLTEIGISSGAALEIAVEDGRLVVTPVRGNGREGWAAEAEAAAREETEEEREWRAFGNEGDADLTW